jgi:hypothetical protein
MLPVKTIRQIIHLDRFDHAAAGGRSSDPEQPRFEHPGFAARGPSIEVAGSSFRDANRNQTLEPYEDRRLGATRRAEDLLSRMTLEEKGVP